MTEDEAKTKWCPHVRQSATFKAGYGFSYNRAMIDNAPESRCIGSACMAWRWLTIRDEGYDPRVDNQRLGFCGLAGKP